MSENTESFLIEAYTVKSIGLDCFGRLNRLLCEGNTV